MTAITTSPWLGTRADQWAREAFPAATLNEQQLRYLFSVEEGGRKVIDLDLKPAVLQITAEIVEIHTRFGHDRMRTLAETTYFWLDNNGNQLAAVVEKYKGPTGVHKPSDTYEKWAEAYLRVPTMRGYDKAEERRYDYLWGIGGDGAVEQIRQFIRDNWITDEC